MKIIYITNARIPTEKAHGLQIMKMCEAFAALDANDANNYANAANKYTVELIVPRRINSIKDDPFEYYGVKKIFNIKKIFCLDFFGFKFIPAKVSFYIQWLSFAIFVSIYAILKYRKDDNIFYSRDWLVLFFLCLFGFNPVAEIHDYKADKPKKWLIGYIMGKVKKIITNSEGTKRFLQEHYRLTDDKFLVASNGVDIDFFNITETKEQARERLNLPQNKVIISYIGRLETLGVEKGVSGLIKAFAQITRQNKNVFLAIIGGPENLIQSYKRQVTSEDILEGDVLFTGQVPYRLIPLYLRAIDIVVVPFPATKQFSFTASPIKIFEFMAAKKAIVVSNLPTLRNILNENNAIFFESENVKDLSEKLGGLINNQALMNELSHRAQELAKEFTWLERAGKIRNFI